MSTGAPHGRPARTLLEQKIWERRQTLEEFAEYAETFARKHGEPGTLSVRHLKRLTAGHDTNGKPVSRPRQVTTRLLERIFETSIEKLLATPVKTTQEATPEDELRARLHAAARLDTATLNLLDSQLTAVRRLDREFGAPLAHGEVLAKLEQVSQLLHYSLTPERRQHLAGHLAELCALAGWQALDMGQLTNAWTYHERGIAAAKQSDNREFEAHTYAERGFILIDLGEPAAAVDLLNTARSTYSRQSGRRMQAWLAAAHGEALAANHEAAASLRAFDNAAALLPNTSVPEDSSAYVALDEVHLARWRGHALARLSDLQAADVLTSALNSLDPSFARAETSLRIDLATAYCSVQEHYEAINQLNTADALAESLGSTRQRSRITAQRHLLGKRNGPLTPDG